MDITVYIQACVPFFSQLCIDMCVKLKTLVTCTIKIYKQFIIGRWFLQFGIDLARNTFVTINHTARTFGYLNTFYPSSWSKAQTISLRGTANSRNVFGSNQQIRTGK